MLETTAERLGAKGGPHWASPDKVPARRLETIALAGELRIPFTSGILIGIGETRAERLEALAALAELHERHGHLQEVIVQNFRAKPGTRMAGHPEPELDDHLWTIAAARLLLPDDVAVQAPPNLAFDGFPRLLDAGIDDWGGVSPVTIDHVNPEAPWPERAALAEATRSRGLELAPRLPVYPRYLDSEWLDAEVLPAALRAADALGLAREDRWHPGERGGVPFEIGRDALPRRHGRRARRGGARPSLPRPRRRAAACLRRRRPAAPRGLRRRGHLRRHAQHPVHERLLLPLRLLRVLEGPAGGEPARRPVPRPHGRDRPPRPRGLGAGRDRGVPAGRHPPGVHGRLLRGRRRGDPRGGARPAHPRLLGARGVAGRGDARRAARRVPRAPALARARLAARDGRGDPRRRGARGHLPRQGDDRRSGSPCTRPRTAPGCART